MQEELRLSTSSGALAGHRVDDGGGAALTLWGSARPTSGEAGDEERPGRDFVDRLWLDAAARCASAQCLVELVQAVLAWLGRPGSVAPFVRRENGTEVAELVRTAVKISTLRRYAASPGGAQLQDLAASWEERRRQLSTVEAVAPLVLGMGVECLRRDFVHVITRRGYIMPQDLDHFTDASRPVEVQVDRLHCLHRMAELALMCTRHRLCFDTMRHLILKAAEHYKRPSVAASLGAPIFAVPLSSASSGRLLSTFPSVEPSTLVAECGGCLLRAERAPSRALAGHDAGDDGGEPGAWSPFAPGSPYEYSVTLLERFQFARA